MSKALVLLTGDVQSGKTTKLLDWCQGRNDVYGILTPDLDSKRYFLNIQTGERFPMEAVGDEESLDVGKYHFSKKSFDRAISILQTHIHSDGWLVLDEIGPLELRGEGFAGIIKKMIEERPSNTLFVVRDVLLDDVTREFGLDGFGPEILMVNDEFIF